MSDLQKALGSLQASIASVIIGKPEIIELTLVTLLAKGHLLIEDVPGVGKTSLAQALAQSLNMTFRRIQFTNDILPTDIIGVSVFNQEKGKFQFKQGPIFSNLVLADEINRSSPRTQSALLEAMNENQVTADNVTHKLDRPFMVIATQNPIESHGAFPLPESQMDRFMMHLSMGYPAPEDEKRLLETRTDQRDPKNLTPVLNREDVAGLQEEAEQVVLEPVLSDYILKIVTATRNSNHLALGVSPRGGLALQQAARARALLKGRNYCIPDDVKQLAVPVFCHRVIPETRHGAHKRSAGDTAPVIREIVEGLEVPV